MNKWWKRGSSRMVFGLGGAYNLATMLISGYYQWATPRTVAKLDRLFSSEGIDSLKKFNINWVLLIGHTSFTIESSMEHYRDLKKIIGMCHEEGIGVSTYMSLTSIHRDQMFENIPESRGWVQVSPEGKHVPYGISPVRILACINNPGWQEYLKRQVDIMVDCGTDVLYYDNIFSMCYCDICRAKFGEFARQRTGFEYELPGMNTGTSDKVQADLEVIRKNEAGYGKTRQISLLAEEFRLRNIEDVVKMLRDYGVSKKQDVKIHVNAHNRPYINDVCDFILTEDSQEPGIVHAEEFAEYNKRTGYCQAMTRIPSGIRHILRNNLGQYRYMYGDGGEAKVFGTYHPMVYNIRRSGKAMEPRSWEKSIYEINMSGGFYWILDRDFFAPSEETPEIYTTVKETHQFLSDHEDLWTDTSPVADVLIPVRSISSSQMAMNTLAGRNAAFDSLPIHQLTPEILKNYKVLLLLEQEYLTDEYICMIRQYVYEGGSLLAVGSTGMLDRNYSERKQSGLSDVLGTLDLPSKQRISNDFGSGRSVCYPDFTAVDLVSKPSVLAQVLDDIKQLGASCPVEISGSEHILGTLWRQERTGRFLIHLLNYSDEPLKGIKLVCRIDGSQVEKCTCVKPGHRTEMLEYTLDRDGFVVIEDIDIDIYSVVVLDTVKVLP